MRHRRPGPTRAFQFAQPEFKPGPGVTWYFSNVMAYVDMEQASSFKDYVTTWKRDAERQEALVSIVAQLLDQECRKNDLQV